MCCLDHSSLPMLCMLHRYLPIGGLKSFNEKSVKLAYGESAPCIQDGRVAAVQSLSGTGSCRLFAEFMRRYLPGAAVYIPKPTWSNHHNILTGLTVIFKKKKRIDISSNKIDGFCEPSHFGFISLLLSNFIIVL